MLKKRDQNKKWLLAGLLPGLAGIIMAIVHWLKRPRIISKSSAMVPLDQTPQVAVTGGMPSKEEEDGEVKDEAQPESGANRKPTGRVSGETVSPAPPGVVIKPQKEPSEKEERPGKEPSPAGYDLTNKTAEIGGMLVLIIPFLALAIAIVVLAFARTPIQSSVVVLGGNADRGRVELQAWNCGTCHTISGVNGAIGKVGPALNEVGLHSFIAGRLENTPDNMIRWIMHPQAVAPGNDMPDIGVPENVARDMAAYLYSLNDRQRSSTLNFNRR